MLKAINITVQKIIHFPEVVTSEIHSSEKN
jgi:hypothetical protein